MDNPTSAENAADRVIDIAIEANASHEEIMGMRKALATALRDARREGMMRAAGIASTYEDWCGNWGAIKNEIAARECSKEIAEAIERAAKED